MLAMAERFVKDRAEEKRPDPTKYGKYLGFRTSRPEGSPANFFETY